MFVYNLHSLVILSMLFSLGGTASEKNSPCATLLKKILISNTRLEELLPLYDFLVKYDYATKLPLFTPIYDSYTLSSRYGWRVHPIHHTKDFHTGIDIACEKATYVHASADGIISFSGWKGGYGNCIIIQHLFGYQSLYGHLSLAYRRTGTLVKQGEVVGFVGSSGISTGNHLHYEVRKKNSPISPILLNHLTKLPK